MDEPYMDTLEVVGGVQGVQGVQTRSQIRMGDPSTGLVLLLHNHEMSVNMFQSHVISSTLRAEPHHSWN